MASPQLGDGFTRIVNPLLEAIYSVNLNGTQFRIILLIIRSTYGFGKTEHEISVSFISNGTGMAQRQVKRELNSLIEMKVVKVIKEATFSESRVLALNKDYEEWGLIRHQVTKTTPDDELVITPGDRLDTSPGDGLDTQKRKYKESIKKEKKQTSISESEDLFERLWRIYPNKKGKSSIKPATKKKLMVIGEENMIQAIKGYMKYCNSEKSWYTPLMGSTFFNSSRYEDYLPGTDEAAKPMTREIKPIKHLTQEDQNELFKQMELDRQQKNIERRERMRGEKVEHDNPGD